jgi:gamma-glutamylputrescine oxidase
MGIAGHVPSYYAATARYDFDLPPLHGSTRADVCVIGGGYTGLSAALHLRERGYDVVLLEAERLAWGASGRNGGQVGPGQRRPQSELESRLGMGHAKLLWDLGLEAVDLVRDLVHRHAIDCDLAEGVMHLGWKQRDIDYYRSELEHMRRGYGYEQLRFVEREEACALSGSKVFLGGLLDTGSLTLHPLNYALGLAQAALAAGVRMHEYSRVQGYTGNDRVRVRTAQGEVDAGHVIVACNGYLERLEPRIAGRIMPINNFMLATAPLDEATAQRLNPHNLGLQDSRFVINYWRMSRDRRLLFGGGENYSSRFPADIRSFVRRHMLEIYPELADTRIDYGWGGTLAITLHRMPAFGRLPNNVFYALGYSGHGIPTATLAGKLLAEAVAGTAERFDIMAKMPSPKFPGGTLLRYPGLVAGMLYYSLRDRL